MRNTALALPMQFKKTIKRYITAGTMTVVITVASNIFLMKKDRAMMNTHMKTPVLTLNILTKCSYIVYFANNTPSINAP